MATPLLKAIFKEGRIPHRYKTLSNFMNENSNLFLRKVLNTPPLKANPKSGTKIVSLVCHRDLNMYILSIKSFLRFYNDINITVFDDGSLEDEDVKKLKHHIKGIDIYKRSYTDNQVKQKLSSQLLKNLREEDPSQLKLIDTNLLLNGKKIILDSDTLFLRKPDEIIEWINTPNPKPFYHTNRVFYRKTPSSGDNIQKQFRNNLLFINKKLKTNIKTLDFCSGFIGYPRKLSLKRIEEVERVLSKYNKNQNSLWGIEQCSYAFLLMDKAEWLNIEYYLALDNEKSKDEQFNKAKFIHFIGKFLHKEYSREAKKIIKELRKWPHHY